VVDFEVRLEDFLREAAGADLVIGEDHHVTCKFNAGVFLLRIGDWAIEFLTKVCDIVVVLCDFVVCHCQDPWRVHSVSACVCMRAS
jgi:hypothetical protein